jgi:maltose alpha-D-glucosyltransferase/alpha-amylase
MGESNDGLNDQFHWYKDAVFYELHIKAFRDGNGDGTGDFKGLLEKLDYLQDLGITAIWLLPFYPSPLKDDGYDIADYYHINSSYGNIDEFKQLLKEAHERKMKVITELVINHTSDQHPWFQRARVSPPDSDYRNFYVWSDNPTKYKDVRIIFQDFETSNWTWDPVANQYFWHRFYSHQPDLNYDNELVHQEVFKMLDYWCELGVDGFRLDAVPYLYEREGTNGENLPETHAFLKKIRKYVDDHHPGTLLLAEANMWPEDSASYFGNGDECHMNYHFPAMPRMFMALQMEDRYPLIDIFDQTPQIPATCQWAMFLRNHDELTLEMVTDEERDYMYKAYVQDPRARINLGIRHRLAALMGNNRKKIELLNYLLFSLPGTPFIYYGDEIGMGDNVYLGDRDGVRTPMQWSPGRNAGFSDANPHKLYLPVILDPDYHYESVNVEMQSRNTSSLLWWMKRLISKRKQYLAFSRGDLTFIHCENPKILAFTRSYEGDTVLVICNLSRYTQPVEIDLQKYRGYLPVEIFSRNKFPSVKENTPYFFTLGPHDCEWFIFEPVNALFKKNELLPLIRLQDWEHANDKRFLEKLELSILSDYMMKMRWFGGKSRNLESLKIVRTHFLPTNGQSVLLLLIEVNYQSGLPEHYHLPISYGSEEFAAKLRDHCPQAVIARLRIGEQEGILYDAIYGLEFQETLLHNLANNAFTKSNGTDLKFASHHDIREYVSTHEKIKPRILSGEQSNSSIIYDSRFFLKMFRKVDRAINPDLEITHFLTERARFPNIPSLLGSVEWKLEKDSIVLGMVQDMVASSGDAWKYVLDRLDDFNEHILADTETIAPPSEILGSIIDPVSYDEVPLLMKEFMESSLAERIHLLGIRTGEMHKALASGIDVPEFKPESYTLHYQRSLFAGLQSLVRRTFENQSQNLHKLPPEIKWQAEEVLNMKDEILTVFKNIYKEKIDVVKIRIHGDFHLGQVLVTGKDFIIIDFEGEPARAYSERRLKRSPLRDVAGMIRSLHYAAYASLFLDNQIRKEDFTKLIPFVEQWYHYMSGFFMRSYMETVRGTDFIPKRKEDLETLMTTFLLEKAIYELNYELNNRPDWVVIPLNGIRTLMKKSHPEIVKNPEMALH